MGGCCAKNRTAVERIAPADVESQERKSGSSAALSHELRSTAQALPRLKFCGDCGGKLGEVPQKCIKCGSRGDAVSCDRAKPPAVAVAPRQLVDLHQKPQAARARDQSLAAHYQSAAWTGSLSPKAGIGQLQRVSAPAGAAAPAPGNVARSRNLPTPQRQPNRSSQPTKGFQNEPDHEMKALIGSLLSGPVPMDSVEDSGTS